MKAACSKSWTDISVDFKRRQIGHCCKAVYYDFPEEYTSDFFDNSPGIQERRQESLEGIQHPDCVECWKDVNKGNTTYIDWWNQWDDFSEAKPNVSQIDSIEIELDNTCDLSCLYCSEDASSKIAQEEGFVVSDKTRQYDIDMFKEWLKNKVNNYNNYDKRLTISFQGGEPTASKLFYELLDFIGTLNTKFLLIDVITNGNSRPHLFKKFLEAIDKINCKWSITISNESFGKDSQQIRYGLDWERFESNVIAYAQHKKISHISLGTTVNNLSLPSFPAYVKWVYDTLRDQPATFQFCGSIITDPLEMDIAILPVSCRSYIDDAIEVVNANKDARCGDMPGNLEFLESMKKRIGSNYREDYQSYIGKFLDYKQKAKKTDTLMRLIKPLDSSRDN